jgi:hypothetical protein
METPVTSGAGRRSSAFVDKDAELAEAPNPSGRVTSAPDFSTPKRSLDARIDPTEALHEGAARNHRPSRRHRWGSCLLLLELHEAPKQQQVAESSIGDGAEAEGAGPTNRSVRGSTGPTPRLARASPQFA